MVAGNLNRKEMCLDGIGVDAVVDFRQFALRRPSNKLLFLILKALKLLYKIQLEGQLIAEPNSKACPYERRCPRTVRA